MAIRDHTRDDGVLAPRENMESTICLLTEWTLKAGGLFLTDTVFLIEKCACAVVGDNVFQFKREIGHTPKRSLLESGYPYRYL